NNRLVLPNTPFLFLQCSGFLPDAEAFGGFKSLGLFQRFTAFADTLVTFVVEFETAVEVASVNSDGHNLPPETLCCFVIQQGGLLDLLLHPKWENGGKSQNIFLQV
ncbi:hypothetical protein, partial [Victivallis vadensis]|uniref:hypothetical protein n=1 Tax=Victivallis vadensis TaxID=172901 RepID=UPI00266D87F2